MKTPSYLKNPGHNSRQLYMRFLRELLDSILGLATSHTSPVVKENRRQIWRVAGESWCATSQVVYDFPFDSWLASGSTSVSFH